MSECARVKPLLATNAAGDLSRDEFRLVQKHLAACSDCRNEESRVSQVILVARSVRKPDCRLPGSLRQRIALEAAERATHRPWIFFLPGRFSVARFGLAASATAFLLITLMALVLRDGAPPQHNPADVTRLEVVAHGGIVKLAWSDGHRDSYTVLKAFDPRNINKGEVHVVRGNIWVDSHPDTSPIVFYRIE